MSEKEKRKDDRLGDVNDGWRVAWSGLGWTLLVVMAPLACLLARRGPEACGLEGDAPAVAGDDEPAAASLTLVEALRTPTFWVFGLGSALYGLVASGTGRKKAYGPL